MKTVGKDAARGIGARAFRTLSTSARADVARMSDEDARECGWGFFGAVHRAREEARSKRREKLIAKLPAELRDDLRGMTREQLIRVADMIAEQLSK